MSEIKTILFDMDGTLYQDFNFHRDYLRYSLENTPYESRLPEALALAERTLDGNGLVMNRFYRLPEAVPAEGALEQTLRGAMQLEMQFAHCYEAGLGNLAYLGDPWEVVTLITAAYGVLEQNGEQAFLRVREEMHRRSIHADPALLSVLLRLKERYHTILLSNSPEQSASDFIEKLGFQDAFCEKIYDAHKPYGLLKTVYRVHPELREQPEQMLSVGDHAFNEIENILLAGGKTLWMNPYGDAPQVDTTWSVRSIAELIAFFEDNFLN